MGDSRRWSLWQRIKRLERWMLLAALAALLLGTNHRFTVQEDEVLILRNALQPGGAILGRFLDASGQHAHPPLSDLLLHAWLGVVDPSPWMMRLPSIVFYVLGLACCAATADVLGSPRSGTLLCWLGLFWPFGFHFGWLFGWFAFAFLLVAAMTLVYVRLDREPTLLGWALLSTLGVALVWTNYYGWIVLGLFVLDALSRHGFRDRRRVLGLITLVVTALLAFMPLLPAMLQAVQSRVVGGRSLFSKLAYGGWNLFALFLSEAVAPWALALSLPGAAAIGVVLLLVIASRDRTVYRLGLGFGVLFTGLAVLGLLGTKRALFITPWFLLTLVLALERQSISRRRTFAGALGTIAVIGWFATLDRRFYATLRLHEPWETVAGRAADETRQGHAVAAYHPVFFYYVTRALAPDALKPAAKPRGLLGEQLSFPGLLNAGATTAPELPKHGQLTFIRSSGFAERQERAELLEKAVAAACEQIGVQGFMKDPMSELKLRFGEDRGHRPWRIEEVRYDCRRQEAVR